MSKTIFTKSKRNMFTSCLHYIIVNDCVYCGNAQSITTEMHQTKQSIKTAVQLRILRALLYQYGTCTQGRQHDSPLKEYLNPEHGKVGAI